MPETRQTSILIADPSHLLSDALGRSLGSLRGFSVVDENPTTGLQTIEFVEIFHPDVLLMEYWMEDLLGPAVIQAIRPKAPDCKVILLSAFVGSRQIVNSFYAGAVGFLPKSVGVDDVAEAVRRSREGESPVFKQQLDEFLRNLGEKDQQASDLWDRMKGLTRRELQILALLSLGRPMKEIAAQLTIAPRTARNYLDNMLHKAGAQSQVELLAMAKDCGLISG